MIGHGDRVGRYTVEYQLGRDSGQGRVYRATDDDDHVYALKIPQGDVRRFTRELDAAQAVKSRCVARVWDHDLAADPPHIAYELVPGQPLDEALHRRTLSVGDLLQIAADAAQGLADIHTVTTDSIPQLSHGDVTLDNIMVTTRNEAVLIDLGAAITGRGSTVSRNLIGKHGYWSPEQLDGDTGGPPSDVWQLAVCIARAGMGVMPFGSGLDSLRRIAEDAPSVHGLDGLLARLIAPCLQKDPRLRPAAAWVAEEARRLRASYDEGEYGNSLSPLQDIVRKVSTIHFRTSRRGLLSRKALLAPLPPDYKTQLTAAAPHVAVGDLVLSRDPALRMLRPSLVTAPPGLQALERPAPPPSPDACHSCQHQLAPLRDAWRSKDSRGRFESVYCPNAGHCPAQDRPLWHRFLHRVQPTRREHPLAALYAPGRWPHTVLTADATSISRACRGRDNLDLLLLNALVRSGNWNPTEYGIAEHMLDDTHLPAWHFCQIFHDHTGGSPAPELLARTFPNMTLPSNGLKLDTAADEVRERYVSRHSLSQYIRNGDGGLPQTTELWDVWVQAKGDFAEQARDNASELLAAYDVPVAPHCLPGLAGRRHPQVQRQPVPLRSLIDGTSPTTLVPKAQAPTVEGWWSEWRQPVLAAAELLESHVTR